MRHIGNRNKLQRTSRYSIAKGFTLIELLVVIAIIALLAAILFPVFARARENARRASCQSNLKQIALGMVQYTQDYDERYPLAFPGARAERYPAFGGNGFNAPQLAASGEPGNIYKAQVYDAGTNDTPIAGNYRTYQDVLMPYLKSVQIFACPSARFDKTLHQYGYSTVISGLDRFTYDTNATNFLPMSQAEVKRSSEIVMLVDYNAVTAIIGVKPDLYPAGLIGDPTLEVIGFPHFDGHNVCFVDGHVKWYGKRSPITNPNSVANRSWNAFLD